MPLDGSAFDDRSDFPTELRVSTPIRKRHLEKSSFLKRYRIKTRCESLPPHLQSPGDAAMPGKATINVEEELSDSPGREDVKKAGVEPILQGRPRFGYCSVDIGVLDLANHTPVVLSFSQLLEEQCVQAQDEQVVQKEQEGHVEKASSSPAPQPRESPVPALPTMHGRDHLSEVIRDMENRLLRQGFLAAPHTIFGSDGKKPGPKPREVELYYHPDEFIDDASLELVNATDQRRRVPSGPRASSSGAAPANGAARPEAKQDSVEREEAEIDVEPLLDVNGFRLVDFDEDDISGTSAASDSGSDPNSEAVEEEEADAVFHGLGWQQRLDAFMEEIQDVQALQEASSSTVIVRDEPGSSSSSTAVATNAVVKREHVDASGARVTLASAAEEPVDTRGQPTIDDPLAAILRVLTDCCRAVQASKELPTTKEQSEAIEAAFKGLWPDLAKSVSTWAGSAATDASAETESGTARNFGVPKLQAASKGCDSRDRELFGWSASEEKAWTRLLWRLVRGALPELRWTTFIERWTAAVREPQREALEAASTLVRQQLRRDLDDETVLAMSAVGQKFSEPEDLSKTDSATLAPLAPALGGLQRCWARQRCWLAQRKESRLEVECDSSMRGDLVKHFAMYAHRELKDHLSLDLPIFCLQSVLRTLRKARPKRKSLKTAGASTSKKTLPIKLPLKIWIRCRGKVVEGTLESCTSMDKQRVTIGTGPYPKEYDSLDSAAHAVWAQHDGPQFAWRRWQGWTLWMFQIPRRVKIVSLAWVAHLSARFKKDAFQNPDGECPGGTLESVSLEHKKISLVKKMTKQTTWSRQPKGFKDGDWARAKYMQHGDGFRGQDYNCMICKKLPDGETYKIRWFDGNYECLHMKKLMRPKVWAIDDIAEVYDRGRWWPGKITGATPNLEHVGRSRYVIQLNADRRVCVGFESLRQHYTAAVLEKQPVDSGGHRSRGRGSSMAGRGQSSRASGRGSGQLPERKFPKTGQTVRFQAGVNMWRQGVFRGVDDKGKVIIETQPGSKLHHMEGSCLDARYAASSGSDAGAQQATSSAVPAIKRRHVSKGPESSATRTVPMSAAKSSDVICVDVGEEDSP